MTAIDTDVFRIAAPRDATASIIDATTDERPPVIALVGRPNVGKSTFFQRLTGRFVETANAPGTTVTTARARLDRGGRQVEIVDLPGTHSLVDQAEGLEAFWRLLLDARPDALLVVVDAGDLARHLPLALASRDLGLPTVVAANLADEAASRGVLVDLGRLSQLLAIPVIRTVGRTGQGVTEALDATLGLMNPRRSRAARQARRAAPTPQYGPAAVAAVNGLARALAGARAGATAAAPSSGAWTTDAAPPAADALRNAVATDRVSPIGAATIGLATMLEAERWAIAGRWASQVERRTDVRPPLADRIAPLVTAPWPGLPLFAAITVSSLLLTMVVGGWLSGLLTAAWTAVVSPTLTAVVGALVPIPALAAATLWALDAGLLSMLSVGIPFVLTFYVLLAVLEDSGYLAAAAVLTDRILNTLGLPGRAAIPILAATGCNVPAIYGTRVLDTRRERWLASFLIVLTPCSARSAVIVAAIAPFLGIGAALLAFGVVVSIGVAAGLAANAVVPGRQSPLVLELPALRAPVARQVAMKAWFRFRSFVRVATPVMVAGSFLLGLAYEGGVVAPLESALAPVSQALLGLPAVAGIALVLAFLRKELALQLLIVLAIARYGASASDLSTFMTGGQLFVFAVVTAVSFPCIATLSSLADEFGWRPALGITGAVLGVAVLAGTVLARLLT